MEPTRFEIIIDLNGERHYLDTFATETISLNYNIADLTDIPARNSSYSKSIRLPETKNNRFIFGNIADLAASTEFNPNKKTRCWVLVDSIMVFEGYLQLRYVYVDELRSKTEYEVVIYADNDNFFKAMGEKYLTDLDWQELNHNWTSENIIASWTASNSSLGYYYPLIDYGFDWDYQKITRPPGAQGPTGTNDPDYYDAVSPIQMLPATNVKYMVDKIFQDAGYQYQSEFFNSDFFKKLYVPFNRKEITNPVNDSNFLFSVGRTSTQSFVTYYTPNAFGLPGTPTGQNYVYRYPDSNVNIPGAYFYNPQPFDFGTFRLPFDSETFPNGDPNNLYNVVTYEFQAPAAGAIPGMQFTVNFDITFQFAIDPAYITPNTNPVFGPAQTPACWIAIRRDRNADGTLATQTKFIPVNGFYGRIPFNSPAITNLQLLDPVQVSVFDPTSNPDPYSTNVTRYKRVRGTLVSDPLTGQFNFGYPIQNSEKVWVEIKIGIANGEFREQINQQVGAGAGWGGNGNGYFVGNNIANGGVLQGATQRPNVPLGSNVGIFQSSIQFYNNIVESLQIGQLINYNEIIPKNIKNKDFFASLVKLFNLYIEPSKQIENVLIVEPRDTYYSAGVIKDWSRKVDISNPIQEQILGETQNREIRLKYRDDNDYFNEDYRKKQNISFGEFRKDLDNEFVTGIKTIEPIFSPTPLVLMRGSQTLIIPKIGTLNNNIFEGTDFNIRILTRYEPNQTINWIFGGLTASPSLIYPNNACITSTGIAPQRQHALNIGDIISINQNDGGILYPTLQGTFEVLEIINSRTIIINVTAPTFAGYIAGVATPIPGVVGCEKWRFQRTNTTLLPYEFNYYPYLGHFSHPRRPNYDLNYGQAVGYYHPLETVTGDNLHRLFWENFLNELTDKDSRIITLNAYLEPEDIFAFKFSDNIYINGQYFKVNKIMNYDPTKRITSKIELIKTKAPLQVPLPTFNFGGVFGRYEAPGPERQPMLTAFPNPTGVLTTNITNSINRADALVIGSENTSTANRSITVGNRNEIYSDLNLLMGDDNLVNAQSNNNLVFGSRNEIKSGVSNAFIFGNDISVASSNTFAFSGVMVSMANLVNASRNEILSPFNIKATNYISASKNSVFEWGTQDPVNYISGQFYYSND